MAERKLSALLLVLVACATPVDGDDPTETDGVIDTDGEVDTDGVVDTDPPAPGWVEVSVPTESHLTEALFLDPPWVFGEHPEVALRLVDEAWDLAPTPPGGRVQAAASFGDTGVVLVQDGSVLTWSGVAWERFTPWVADEPVLELALGSVGELYVVTETGLVVVLDGVATRYDRGCTDVWARPEGGALVLEPGVGVLYVDPNTAPTVRSPNTAGPQVLCGSAADDVWVFGNGPDDGKLVGNFDGASWSWDDGGSGRRPKEYVGAWCPPDGEPVAGNVSCVHSSQPVPGWSCRLYTATRSSKDVWIPTEGDPPCGFGANRLFNPKPEYPPVPCSVHGEGELGLVLGPFGTLRRWGL